MTENGFQKDCELEIGGNSFTQGRKSARIFEIMAHD
jgi:hypothetical protein